MEALGVLLFAAVWLCLPLLPLYLLVALALLGAVVAWLCAVAFLGLVNALQLVARLFAGACKYIAAGYL